MVKEFRKFSERCLNKATHNFEVFQSDLDAPGSSLYRIYYSARPPGYCAIWILEVKGKSRESGRKKKVGQGEEGQSKKD